MSGPYPVMENADTDQHLASATNALAEIGGDLQAALARYMQSTTGEWRALLADLEKRHEAANWRSAEGERDTIAGLLEFTRSAMSGFERMVTEGPPQEDHLTPADFSWLHVSETWTYDEA